MNKHLASGELPWLSSGHPAWHPGCPESAHMCYVLVTQTYTERGASAAAPCWKWFSKQKFLSRDEMRVYEGLSVCSSSWTHENSCACTEPRALLWDGRAP